MKIPEPKKLPSGSWNIYLRLGGRGISITEASKQSCIAKARSVKAEYLNGGMDNSDIDRRKLSGASRYTLAVVIDNYIRRYGAVLSPSTVRGYGIIRRNRFKAYMDTPVSKIDWQEMVNKELKEVSAKTVKNAWGLVTASVKEAGYPEPHIKPPKAEVPDLSYLRPEEIPVFIAEIEGDSAELLLLLELNGLRYSEARAIRDDNIDLKAWTVTVKGAVVPGPDHKFVEKATNKTKKSARVVPILIPRLKHLLQQTRGDDLKEAVSLHSLTAGKHSEAACKRAGITVVKNHDLRRSFASLCRSLGIPEEQTMAWGGWSDYVTMHSHYVKMSEKAMNDNKSKVEAFFRNADENADGL